MILKDSVKILSFGEIIWDIYPEGQCIGGAPLNFAAHAVKSGANAFLLSSIGNDDLSLPTLIELGRLGISDCYVTKNDHLPTGRCNVTLDENAVPTYDIVKDTAYDAITLPQGIENEHFDALAFGTLALRSEENLKTLKKLLSLVIFDRIFCDINLRAPFYGKETIAFCLSAANILKLSDTELDTLKEYFSELRGLPTEKAIRELTLLFPCLDTVILTCGENGAFAYTVKDASLVYRPAEKVKVASTVGAGDSFGAVFLVNHLRGCSTSKCLDMATERSAYVVSHTEAVPD